MGDVEFRLGRWQEVLADIEAVDVLATDPPYSERTHGGYRTGSDIGVNNAIGYVAITEDEIRAFVASWAPRIRRWAILFCDHLGFRLWEAAWEAQGWRTFAPVVWLKTDAPPRFAGDGPQSSAEYLCVARPPGRVREHSGRPGYYLVMVDKSNPDGGRVVGQKKPVDLRRLLLDYSRPGDAIADPFGGSASMGQACIETGRRYIGSEMDPDTHAKGLARLAKAGPDPVLVDRWREPRRQTGFGW